MQEVNIRTVEQAIPGITRTHRFLHITDAHLVLFDEKETEARAAYARPRVELFSREGIYSPEWLDRLMDWVSAHRAALDGVIFTGDIIDFPSAPNRTRLAQVLAALPVPYIYVLGNHDWAYFDDYHTPHSRVAERPKFHEISGGNTFVHKARFGEITVVAVDNTMERYEDGVAETLHDALAGEETVLLAQHIPLYAETLHADTVQYWGRDINIGGEALCHNENWKQVLQTVTAENSPVRSLITGHLHFWHQDMVAGCLPQYVTALAAEGNAGLYVFTPAGKV